MTAAVIARTPFRHLVAAEIRAHLARKRISGRQLARMLDEPPSWAARRLAGDTAMDADDLERIAEALGMDPVELLASVPSGNTVHRAVNYRYSHCSAASLTGRHRWGRVAARVPRQAPPSLLRSSEERSCLRAIA